MDQPGYVGVQSDAGLKGFSVGEIALILLIGAALLPVLLVRIPAMVDYPDHLARMYLLHANGTAAANPYYRVVWVLYPDLAMDLEAAVAVQHPERLRASRLVGERGGARRLACDYG